LDDFEFLGAYDGERRWRDGDGHLYTWDGVHGEVEVFNRRGRHLGALDPLSGKKLKNAIPGRKINV
jgi:hypothetical protein